MNKIAETLANSITLSTNEKLAMINLSGGGLSAGNPLSNFLRKNIKNPVNNYLFSSNLKDPFSSVANYKSYLSSAPQNIRNSMWNPQAFSTPGRGASVSDIMRNIVNGLRGR
jgi:hypothetical protein